MADGVTFKIEGARELHDALGEFAKATERGVLRRVAVQALTPVIERARELVPVHEGHLRDSLTVGTKLTKRARRAAKEDPVDGVRVFAGSANRNAVPREFGTWRTRAEPFLTPAWDGERAATLGRVEDGLATEIERTRKRVAARTLKAKG